MEIQWEIVENSNLSILDKERIAKLKDQHWKYGMQSQLKWLYDNIYKKDLHLLGRAKNSEIFAYLNMVQLCVKFGDTQCDCIGIGNVCVDKIYEHAGYGMRLLREANKFIKQTDKQGILLCKNTLVGFYQKCDWKEIKALEVYVAFEKYQCNVMVYPERKAKEDIIVIDRNF